MDFKRTNQEKNDHDLLQLQNIQSSPFPIPNLSQSVLQKPHGAARSYRECLKNHAASTGGNVLDGCGEFMPDGQVGTPESFKCAACHCHRSFHRREPHDSSVEITMVQYPLQLPPPLPSPTSTSVKQSNGQWITNLPLTVKMGLGSSGGAATESSSEEMNLNSGADPACFVLSKKRSQEQKEKMMEFAEKVGWRIPREDDAEARRFCVEAGVKRHVLKVWMHNNKIAKKEEECIINFIIKKI